MSLSQEEKILAEELAISLNDQGSRQLYETFAAEYPEYLLRRILEEVLRVPAARIKKSRGALFTYLLRKYAASKSNNDWH